MHIQRVVTLLALFAASYTASGQTQSLPIIQQAEAQPLLSQSLRLQQALQFLGSALREDDVNRLTQLQQQKADAATIKNIQAILDPYCLLMVDINPEARVKTIRGNAAARLVRGGWTSFLVKVHNAAGITSRLEVHSEQSQPLFHISSGAARPQKENLLTAGQVDSRFLELAMYRNLPLLPALSGARLEYAVLQVYSRDAGKREAMIGFHVGQGTQDLAFRNAIPLLFDIAQPVKVKLNIAEEDGTPTMASVIFRDHVERIIEDTASNISSVDYHYTKSLHEYWKYDKTLRGIYPLPSRRLAANDEYPDFFFQPQVYRQHGEYIDLPKGKYTVTYSRGPEYLSQTDSFEVGDDNNSAEIKIIPKRWIDMSRLGWHSGDHHVHAAGCSHYESPEEGVEPKAMWRQQLGEDLDIAAVLTWGPGWYHQKQYFAGTKNTFENKSSVMRYDVEVSGFPSSHAGHIVLLGLREDDYPGTHEIEEWPSWTVPVLEWAKSQGALTGYAHSGWGLEPKTQTDQLPNFETPKMDGIGANEYVVSVTKNLIDFYSAGDTPLDWELNLWYHTLNTGFRTRISGESDFPCIYDERVGTARSYVRLDPPVSYEGYLQAIKTGRSYVTEGRTHIIDFKVNGTECGTRDSELHFRSATDVTITAKVAAYLDEVQTPQSKSIAARSIVEQPYWHIERARIDGTRNITVELLVNGEVADTATVQANGQWNDVSFKTKIPRSAWVALRVKYAAHTNPFFVTIDRQPVAVQQSAEWCLRAVDECWKNKQASIRESERKNATTAYDAARQYFRGIMRK